MTYVKNTTIYKLKNPQQKHSVYEDKRDTKIKVVSLKENLYEIL